MTAVPDVFAMDPILCTMLSCKIRRYDAGHNNKFLTDGKNTMTKKKREYFRKKLLDWREQLIKEASKTLDMERTNQRTDSGDFGDKASAETDHNIMLRIREREKKLIKKIDSTLDKIDNETFGVCEECGGAISEKRLEARLVASLCIDCKTEQEKRER